MLLGLRTEARNQAFYIQSIKKFTHFNVSKNEQMML